MKPSWTNPSIFTVITNFLGRYPISSTSNQKRRMKFYAALNNHTTQRYDFQESLSPKELRHLLFLLNANPSLISILNELNFLKNSSCTWVIVSISQLSKKSSFEETLRKKLEGVLRNWLTTSWFSRFTISTDEVTVLINLWTIWSWSRSISFLKAERYFSLIDAFISSRYFL